MKRLLVNLERCAKNAFLSQVVAVDAMKKTIKEMILYKLITIPIIVMVQLLVSKEDK